MGINKIEVFGNQICGYINVMEQTLTESDKMDFRSLNPFANDKSAMWKPNTKLLALFDGKLSGGGTADGVNITNWSLYRKEVGKNYLEFVKRVNAEEEYVLDYLVKNQAKYIYYLFPDTDDYIGSPIKSNIVESDWWNWSLMVVNETGTYKHYELDKIYQFDINLSTSDMNNNARINKLNNFTPHPKIQKSPSNYWSGELKSLIGYISPYTNQYIDTVDLINELKTLSTDTRKKFLKDRKGNLWEVDITEPISMKYMDEISVQPTEITLGWTEVGEVHGVSITNNGEHDQFVLSENGIPLQNVNYQWLYNGIWDSKRYWTPNYQKE